MCSPARSCVASSPCPIPPVSTGGTSTGGSNPTGTVTFKLFSDAACTNEVFTSTSTLSGDTATSGAFAPASPGTYFWTAVYNGDANNATATSACGAPNESAVITQAAPTITTQASAGGPVGTSLTDTASVAGGSSPTGTVTFKLFSDAACTIQVFTSTNALSGGTATSGGFAPASPGTYFWTAVYNGDANNAGATSACGAPNESAVITQAAPTITTQASAGGPVGTSLTDTATVAGGSNPTGTVTFKLFSDAACTVQVFTSTNAVLGGSATSGAFAPASPGTYFRTAVYNGDVNNAGATSACGAPNESAVIGKASPTITTQASPGGLLGTAISDTATVAGGAGPTGTVTFKLFSDAACTTQVFTSTNGLSGGTATSGTFTPATPGTYFWTATYNGDAAHNAAISACGAPNESAMIAPFTPPPPTRTLTGDVVGPVVVNTGESVLVNGARVSGPITVNPGGALTVVNSQVTNGIVADNPSFLSICGAQIAAPPSDPASALVVRNASVPVRIGDPAAGCAGNRIAGGVRLTGNTSGLTFGGNTVSQHVTVDSNAGTVVIKANNIFGTLGCAGNVPAPTNAGQPNTAASKTGQCSVL